MAKKSAVYMDYTIVVEYNGTINIYHGDKLCKNSMATMREISKQCRFTIDENWNTRQTGSKLIDFLNSKQQEFFNNYSALLEVVEQKQNKEQNSKQIGGFKQQKGKKKIVLDLILTTEPDRPVYILGTHVLLNKKVNDVKELPAIYEELYKNAEHQNEVALLDICGNPKALLEVYNVETNKSWGKNVIDMYCSWATKIDNNLNEEEQEDLQNVRQAISNSHLSENTPMEEAMVETLNYIKTEDDHLFLPSLLRTMCEREYRQYDDNTQYVLAVEKYSQVQIRYRVEIDTEKIYIDPAFWGLSGLGWKLPSLGEFSLENFHKGKHFLLNIIQSYIAKNDTSEIIYNCTEIKYNRDDMEQGKYCLVNSKLEEIGVSWDLGVKNYASKLFAKSISKLEKKQATNEVIVRIPIGLLYKRCFEDPEEGDERVIFSYQVLNELDLEVEVGGKVSNYTFGDPASLDDSLWSADETDIRCFKEGWEEIDSEIYDDVTLEYVIPLKEGEEFDPEKLGFVESADNIYGDYCIDPAFIFYFHDKKNIEEIHESSGVLEELM